MKDLIDEAVKNITKWEAITLSGHDNVADYCKLSVNRALRLARIKYNRIGVKKGVASSKDSSNNNQNSSPYWVVGVQTEGAIILHKEGAIPDDYQPTGLVSQSFYRGDFTFRIETNGSITVNNSSGKGSKTNGINIHQNILYHY